MSLSDTEKVRIRYHLGYPNVTAIASLNAGIPIPLQTLFLVENAMDRVIDEALPIVRTHIQTLDNIECQLVEGQRNLAVNRLGDMEIRREHLDQLEGEYRRWANRLADTLGVPLYPYSSKLKSTRVGNMTVR